MILIVALIFCIICSIWVWIIDRRKRQSLFQKHGIPFVSPHLIYGSLHELRQNSKNENELEVMEKWIRKHGKVFGYYIGYRPYLLVADLNMAKEILLRRSNNYINRPKIAIKAEPVTETLVGLRDERWKEVRKVLSPAFTTAKIKLMSQIIDDKINILISLLEETANSNQRVDWLSLFQGFTLDVISCCAFAMETSCMVKQDKDPLFAAVRQFLRDAINKAVLWAQYFPIIALIMTLINNYWCKSGKATQMIIANIEKAIRLRRSSPKSTRKDLLQLILDNSETSRGVYAVGNKNQMKPLSDKEIIANAWVFLLGGYETTAVSLGFTSYLLARHPEVQDKLYAEINNPQVQKCILNMDIQAILDLEYLDEVFNESLRLYPPVSTFLQRETADDDVVNGIVIPKETTVVVPIWHFHHDSNLWPDPYDFRPERFCGQNKSGASGRHPLAFIPFGAGPRNCIGMKFGQAVVKVALIRILSQFRIETCSETPENLTLSVPTVTLTPNEKLIMRPVKRH